MGGLWGQSPPQQKGKPPNASKRAFDPVQIAITRLHMKSYRLRNPFPKRTRRAESESEAKHHLSLNENVYKQK